MPSYGVRRIVVDRDRVERVADRPGVGRGDDAAVGEHDEMRVVNRQERRQEQRLRILEVLVEDLRDVFRIEPHGWSIAPSRIRLQRPDLLRRRGRALRASTPMRPTTCRARSRRQQRAADVLAHAEPRVEHFHGQLLGDGIGHPERAHDAAVMCDVRGAERSHPTR